MTLTPLPAGLDSAELAHDISSNLTSASKLKALSNSTALSNPLLSTTPHDPSSPPPPSSDISISGLVDEIVRDEIPIAPEPPGITLDSVIDPITSENVKPPPYVVSLHAIEFAIKSLEREGVVLPEVEKQSIR